MALPIAIEYDWAGMVFEHGLIESSLAISDVLVDLSTREDHAKGVAGPHAADPSNSKGLQPGNKLLRNVEGTEFVTSLRSFREDRSRIQKETTPEVVCDCAARSILIQLVPDPSL